VPQFLKIILAGFVFVLLALGVTAVGQDNKIDGAKSTKATTDTGKADKADNAAKSDPADSSDQVKTDSSADTPSDKKPAPAEYRFETGNEPQLSAIGSVDPESGFKHELKISGWGGSIYMLRLSAYHRRAFANEELKNQDTTLDADGDAFADVKRSKPIPEAKQAAYKVLQHNAYLAQTAFEVDGVWSFMFLPGWIEVEDHRIFLGNAAWKLESPGTYSLRILDKQDKPVIKITRSYSVEKDSYVVHSRQRFENLTDRKLKVTWDQYAHGDLEQAPGAYVGRQMTAGYRNIGAESEAERAKINLVTQSGFGGTRENFVPRADMVALYDEDPEKLSKAKWNSIEGFPEKYQLVWFASVNRYFAVITMPLIAKDGDKSVEVQSLAIDNAFDRNKLGFDVRGQGDVKARKLRFTMTSKPFTLAAKAKKGAKANLDMSIYAGPRDFDILTTPPLHELALDQLVEYNLGCFCTIQWLAKGLLWLLDLFHTVVRDWGVAIVMLVLLVRLILHPITKRSQINMMRMQKQMASIKPEMDKLKKKYEKDAKRMQQEQAKLFQEKGINPLNMLGCLPMFLQMPIWIALYAMLYFAIELRHEAAFWGFFQLFGNWQFLGDLSIPDRFITFFNEPRQAQILFFNFDYSSINILPLLMGIVFFVQQKLTTPPATDEKQAQQQKMMRIIPFIFPIFMYTMPAGLNLYILASTFSGIIDSYIVRRHIKREEEAGTLLQKKEPKKGGFRDRLIKAMEEQRKQADTRDNNLRGNKGKRPGDKRKKRR